MLWSLYMSFKIAANKRMSFHSAYWQSHGGVGAEGSCDNREV